MNFEKLLTNFTSSVEENDGKKLANLFTEDGVYDDYIYGPFKGRENIYTMLLDHFHKDSKNLNWKMYDSVYLNGMGYARYRFSFTSSLEEYYGRKVAITGIAFFRLKKQLIEYYGESVNGGIAMAQLGLPAGKIKRVFEKWSDRLLKSDLELNFMYRKKDTD